MTSLLDRLPDSVARVLRPLAPHSNILMFAAGFLFDLLTMQRIDAWTDLAFQLAYLAGLTGLIVLQHREQAGLWTPSGRLARVWPYNVDALHFLYGGLLSAYVVLYFRSSTGARPLVFFVLLVGLMVVNEMPQIRRSGHRLRLGLYALCVVSFLNYFIPILLGRMGGWVFALALASSAGVVWVMAGGLARSAAVPRTERLRLYAPAAAVCVCIGLLYVFKLIPPVPLSVQFQGIYHDVRRDGGRYTLVYERSPAWEFWRKDSRPFSRRPGDRLYYFARVFAPTRFQPLIVTAWEREGSDGSWGVADRIPLNIVGGRTEGYRTFAYKANFEPGRWRVTVETDDGRAIAILTFQVVADTGEGERRWETLVE
jgi:hypothetical protein